MQYIRYLEVLEEYSDTNWISGISDSKATNSYVFILGGAAVSWKSSRKTVITKFRMEFEFVALDKYEKRLNGYETFCRIFLSG